jgi:hypothetical protein
MKTSKIWGLALLVPAAAASIFIAGCEKNDLGSPAPGNSVDNSNPGQQAYTANLVLNKAYVAATDPSATCSPMTGYYNSDIYYFDYATGLNGTLVNDQECFTRGLAANPLSCELWAAYSDANNTTSDLYKFNSNGTTTWVGALTYSGNPLYVAEMEFDENGDLYILSQVGANLYKVTAANLSSGTPTASLVGTYLSVARGTTVTKSLALRGSDLMITYELSTNSTNTFVGIISKTNASISSLTTFTGLSPNSGDFATYCTSSSSAVYFAKGSNLYALTPSPGNTVSAPGATNSSFGLLSTYNDMTMRYSCPNNQ